MAQKGQLKRIDWDMVKRLVTVIHNLNKVKKTTLAMECRMSYDKFLLYLGWMEIMDLITKDVDEDGFELIGLNRRGMDLYQRQFENVNNVIAIK